MKRKLTLHRETVRVLAGEIARVRGGAINTGKTNDCGTFTCDTWTNPVPSNGCTTPAGTINRDCTFVACTAMVC